MPPGANAYNTPRRKRHTHAPPQKTQTNARQKKAHTRPAAKDINTRPAEKDTHIRPVAEGANTRPAEKDAGKPESGKSSLENEFPVPCNCVWHHLSESFGIASKFLFVKMKEKEFTDTVIVSKLKFKFFLKIRKNGL